MALRKPEMEAKINGKRIVMRRRGTAGVLGTGNLFMLSQRSGMIDDFMFYYRDDDYKMMNKIIGAMICDIQLYKLVKSKSC